MPQLLIGSVTPPTGTLAWQPSIPTQNLIVGQPYSLDLDTLCTGATGYSIVSGALPAGLSFNGATGVVSGTPTTTETQAVTFRADDTAVGGGPVGTADQDWLLRSTGPGVVWAHDFRNQAEVDRFRWTAGYSGGNDPNAVGTRATQCSRVADGPTGFCVEQFRPAGGTDSGGMWWRPFSPMDNSGTGAPDAADGGALPRQTWAPTNGGSQTAGWAPKGFFGHSSYSGNPGYIGNEFWLQMRVKLDPRRITGGNQNSTVGKLLYLTITSFSLSSQELVTYSAAPKGSPLRNYFRMYASGSPPLEDLDSLGRSGQQLGSDLGFCDINNNNLTNCLYWTGGWDTVMYHLLPGRAGVSETKIQVYFAQQGQTVFKKIWDETFPIGFEVVNGWQAMICSTYNNGNNLPQDYFARYTQIILARGNNPIPCPKV